MVFCCNHCNKEHIDIFFHCSQFQLYTITRKPSSSESGAVICLCMQNDGVSYKPENGGRSAVNELLVAYMLAVIQSKTNSVIFLFLSFFKALPQNMTSLFLLLTA